MDGPLGWLFDGILTMKKPLVLIATTMALGASSAAFAVDIARVLSATPVVQQVAVPRQMCTDQQVEVQQPKSGAGAALGAIAGGALGNAAGGRGAGRAAATVLGAVGGAVLGDRIEGAPGSQLQTVRQCSMQTTYENRTVAYNVVYEFAGKQYSTQMPHDPGPTLALQIGPAGASNYEEQEPVNTAQPSYAPPQTYAQQPPVYVQQAPVVVTQPYPVYYTRPYYPPIALEFGFGWGGYRGGWGGHHWR